MDYLLSHQAADGSWGGSPPKCSCKREKDAGQDGDVETTSWAILAFAGAGFTELSTEERKGRKVGSAIKSALDWLEERQEKSGANGKGTDAEIALAAFALLETHGMTERRKESASRAFEWVKQAKPTDPLAKIRIGMAWESAMLCQLTVSAREELRSLAAELDATPGDEGLIGSFLLRAFTKHGQKNEGFRINLDAFDRTKLSPELLNDLAIAAYQVNDLDGWHRWYAEVQNGIVSVQHRLAGACESGSWGGDSLRNRLRTTAQRTCTLEHYRCFYCQGAFRRDK